MKKYVKIEPIKISTGEQLDELRVEVAYDLGGYRTRRGIHAYIKPVHREKISRGFVTEQCVINFGCGTKEDGFRSTLLELKRKNQKKEDAIAKAVLDDEQMAFYAEQWNEGNFQAVANRMFELADKA